jgi:hypothetical protein
MSLESRLSERQFFGFSLVGLGLVIAGLYFGVLRPQMRERAELRRDIAQKTQQLSSGGYLLGEGPLLQRKAGLERDLSRRIAEWQDVSSRLATFGENEAGDVGKIDYKFQLYATRDRLRRKAREQRIDVPALLGLPDEIDSDEVARERMLQLRAVEKLVDTAIEFGIADIRSIDPLAPVVHSIGTPPAVFLEEYPLRVIFEGDMQRLYRLWEAIFQPGRAMLLRNIAMEKTTLAKPDEVRMTATLSSFLFAKDVRNISTTQGRPAERTRAMGH